jgi:hypothetical protein
MLLDPGRPAALSYLPCWATQPKKDEPMNAPAQDLQQQLHSEAERDPAFRQRLLADPHAAIEEKTGASLSRDVEIRAYEAGDGSVRLELPDPPQAARVTDEELEAVAGGGCSGIFSKPLCWSTTPLCWNTKPI